MQSSTLPPFVIEHAPLPTRTRALRFASWTGIGAAVAVLVLKAGASLWLNSDFTLVFAGLLGAVGVTTMVWNLRLKK